MDITKNLTSYLELILVVATIFSGIILKSAHASLFADFSHTLRIVEILGLSRRRQAGIFWLIYGIVIPGAFLLSLLMGYGIFLVLQSIPMLSDFRFLVPPVFFSLLITGILVIIAFLPAWIEKFQLNMFLIKYIPKNIRTRIPFVFHYESLLTFFGMLGIVWIIFDRFLLSLQIVLAGMSIFFVLGIMFSAMYRYLFRRVTRYRYSRFTVFDGIRALVRPMTPSIPITISLVGMTTFFVIFSLFSLSFRSELMQDTANSANIYAINILPSDRDALKKSLPQALMYSIIRARISTINGKSLSEHLNQKEPSTEFTREFNITTSPLDIPIIKGNGSLKADEVSVDADFSQRIGIKVGDRLEFNISGKKTTLTVANLRESVRDGFKPFFYFAFQEEAFKNAPKTYILSDYSANAEVWKKTVLANSGPHVTFVDIENILKIIQDIASQILSIIGLFFFVIIIFFLFAIIALFRQMRAIDALKNRLYPLFGMIPPKVYETLLVSRTALLCLSGGISLIMGIFGAIYIIELRGLLTVNGASIALVSLLILVMYGLLGILVRPQRN